ncbi:hypothetical protein DFH11DRAFT_1727520 [Phellopilus nigrolimitatus]|nr:hypothetical protein DFH11DRAFT_1727520 [Phellopilus nigrolimitatus]
MSTTPAPQIMATSGRSTPATRPSATPTPSSSKTSSSHKPKPANVFSDDGSFLERFKRTKMEDEDKKKREQELETKRQFENRFKNRGKRRAPSSEPSAESSDDAPAKKPKINTEKALTAYEKEVKSYTGSLKDNGMGIRPLVK